MHCHKVLMRQRIVKTLAAVLMMLPGILPLPAYAQDARRSAEKNIILATTTSTQDSGLLDALLPVFEQKTGYFVKTIAVGSGQAMAMGRRGEADVLLVHSPEDEEKFMQEGNGSRRLPVMHNDFVIVGRKDDPARITAAQSAREAFAKIAASKALFLSRGDNSGTHTREKAVWKETGINPEGQTWYQETGLGMGQTLGVASEKKGYTLTDRGTYLALRKNLALDIVRQGDRLLMNIYHVIEVNREKFPKVNADGARAFADFMTGREAQGRIATFGIETFGEPLFSPDAVK